MDMRFEVLLRETINSGSLSRYIARRMAGDKQVQVPDMLELPDVKLFNRLGQAKTVKRGKYYDEMTQDEIAKRMRSFKIVTQARKAAKGQK